MTWPPPSGDPAPLPPPSGAPVPLPPPVGTPVPLPPPVGTPVPLPPPVDRPVRRRTREADYPGCPVTVDIARGRGVVLVRPRWGLWDAAATLLASIGLSVVIIVVVAAVAIAQGRPAGELGGGEILLTIVVPWIGLAGWPLLATATRGNGPRIDLGLRLSWRDVAWGAFGGVAAIFVGTLLAGLTIAVFGEIDSAAAQVAEDLLRQGDRWMLITMAVLVLIGAPIVEEIAFRGMVYNSAAKRGWVPWVTIPVSALAFALFHFEPQRLLILFGIGIVLGIVRWRVRSLGACMVAHGINNLPSAIYIATLS